MDALTMLAHGFDAVSVSSATTVIKSDGNLHLSQENIQWLCEAEKIFLAFDQDEAGQKCGAAFEKVLPPYKTFRLVWKYGGKESTDPKDVGELYAQSVTGFRERIEQLTQVAVSRLSLWRSAFKRKSEMEQGDIRFLIKEFLPEGVCFIGGLSNSGKTWFALSIAKALTSGQRFLGRFEVPEPVPVIYLTPESGELAFRGRLDKLGIAEERFLCRTMKDGVPLKLDDTRLFDAVRELRPVIFLDTAIRFSGAESENAANENSRELADGIFGLLKAGARAVIGLHHSPKASANQVLTLENTLRGTGDIAAMCDTVYGLKCVSKDTLEIRVSCVKPRDFEPVPPFHVQGRPCINEIGDFGILVEPGLTKELADAEKLAAVIGANPHASYRHLEEQTGIKRSLISKVASRAGWKKVGKQWVETEVQSSLIN